MKKIISLLILIILVTGGFYVFTNKVLNSPIKNSGDQKSFSSVILEDIPANIDESEGSNDYRLVKINKEFLDLEEEKYTDDKATAYSLILRLRGIYLINLLLDGKSYNYNDFK